MTVYRLRVVVARISPLIWQRLEVADGTTSAGLHAIVQAVFGWSGEHLHRFVIGGTTPAAYDAQRAALVCVAPYLLTATAANAVALAPPGERYTAFTGTLLGLLNGGIPGGPDHFTFDLIYPHLQHALTSRQSAGSRAKQRGGLLVRDHGGSIIERSRNAPRPRTGEEAD
jgi:hypothetical protein